MSAPDSPGSPTVAPGSAGMGLSRGAVSVASEPSPACVAPTNTEPQARRVPAARPQARPTRIARPPMVRRVGAPPTTESGAVSSLSVTPGRTPPTHAIKAVAEGPEPDFLRRRAVIVRHHGSPHGSGTGEEYRLSRVCLDPSLLRRSTPAAPRQRGYAPHRHRNACPADYVCLPCFFRVASLPLPHFRLGLLLECLCVCAEGLGQLIEAWHASLPTSWWPRAAARVPPPPRLLHRRITITGKSISRLAPKRTRRASPFRTWLTLGVSRFAQRAPEDISGWPPATRLISSSATSPSPATRRCVSY